jgi:hypothetical protein
MCQGCKFLATERRNLASQMNGGRRKRAKVEQSALYKPGNPGLSGPKGIVLTDCPQAPATNVPNESLTACTRFANQINHFSTRSFTINLS